MIESPERKGNHHNDHLKSQSNEANPTTMESGFIHNSPLLAHLKKDNMNMAPDSAIQTAKVNGHSAQGTPSTISSPSSVFTNGCDLTNSLGSIQSPNSETLISPGAPHSGIAGCRVDSGFHSVGGDVSLKSVEDERQAPIARITELELNTPTPEADAHPDGPRLLVTSATPPSLPQSPVEEQACMDATRQPPKQLYTTENRSSSLPHSRHASLSPRRQRRKTVPRKQTVTGVTQEARIVLEQLLRRSFSQNDASPRGTLQHEYQGITEMTIIDEQPVPPRSPLNRNTSYQAATADSAADRSAGTPLGPPPKSDSFDYMYNDDDLTSHSPMSKTNSIISGSSRSSSFRQRFVVKPLPNEDVEAALQGKAKKKAKVKRRVRRDSTSSSSSSSDYDTFDSRKGARRKKSFFKKARERLRQSFRIKKERGPDFDDQSDNEKYDTKPKKKKSPKKRYQLGKSPSNASDNLVHTHFHKHVHQEQNQFGNGEIVVLRTEDIDVIQDDREGHHVEVKYEQKESWPKEKESSSLWDSILKQIRKGGDKLKRKGSKGMQNNFILLHGLNCIK